MSRGDVEFEVWGARGSRSLAPPVSRIANYTSCYSVRSGGELFVLDGGRGLGVLSHALQTEARFRGVERVRLLLSHSHMDHWEGLKDASWFWTNGNGLDLEVLGTPEAIRSVTRGYDPPAYVPLTLLAERTLKKLRLTPLDSHRRLRLRGWTVRPFALNHYSGVGREKHALDTVGYRLRSPEGFVLVYLCDHEPTAETAETDERMIEGADIAILDAHFPDRSQHAFGHGSQEHAAEMARRHTGTMVLAAHHGPTLTDREIRRSHRRHGAKLGNFAIASEGLRLSWSAASRKLERVEGRALPRSR